MMMMMIMIIIIIITMQVIEINNSCSGDDDINNSIKLFITYVPSQKLQGHLQKLHGVNATNYFTGKRIWATATGPV
jgi:hypothetical protein